MASAPSYFLSFPITVVPRAMASTLCESTKPWFVQRALYIIDSYNVLHTPLIRTTLDRYVWINVLQIRGFVQRTTLMNVVQIHRFVWCSSTLNESDSYNVDEHCTKHIHTIYKRVQQCTLYNINVVPSTTVHRSTYYTVKQSKIFSTNKDELSA